MLVIAATEEPAGENAGGDVADWLKEVGKRVPAKSAELKPTQSAEELLEYLRTITGRPIRTKEDIREYLEALHREQIAANQSLSRRRLWREAALLLFVVLAYLQYYYWDVQLQIEKLPRLVANVADKRVN